MHQKILYVYLKALPNYTLGANPTILERSRLFFLSWIIYVCIIYYNTVNTKVFIKLDKVRQSGWLQEL